jgi:DNA-binding MarR family transcriptional regulator
MEKKGLITKVKDSDRKNMWRVALTEKGQNAYRQSVKRESIHAAMSSLSEKERLQLGSYLEKLRDCALTQLVRDMKPPFP